MLIVALLANVIAPPVFRVTTPGFNTMVLPTFNKAPKASAAWLLVNCATLIVPTDVTKPDAPTVKLFNETDPAPDRVPPVNVNAVVPVRLPVTVNEALALLIVKLLSSVTATPSGITTTSAAVILKLGAVPPHVVELDQLPVVVAV